MNVVQEFIINDLGKVRELVVIDEHRIALCYHLFYEWSVDRVGLAGAGSTQHHGGSERIDDIDPALTDPVLVLKPHRDVDGIVSLHLLGALTEGLVAVIYSLVECTEFPAGRGYRPS